MRADTQQFLRERIRAVRRDKVPVNRSLWFNEDYLNVYLRAGRIYNHIDRKFQVGVCVSNIEVLREHRGRGHFREFLQELEKLAAELGYRDISFESVGSPRLERILDKHGYTKSDREYDPWPNYYKQLNAIAPGAKRGRTAEDVQHL